MACPEKSREDLQCEIKELRAQLAEAEEILRAIRTGEVDALAICTPAGQQIFTLQSADQAYRTIIEQMHEGAITLVADGYISYSNRSFAEMVKCPLEQIMGTHVREYVISADQDCLHQLMGQHVGDAGAELTLQAKDGAMLPIHASLSQIVLDGLSSTCMVITDLTARRRVEQLLASEQLTHAILNQSADGILVCDMQGHLMLTNPAARRIMQLDSRETPGTTAGQLWHQVFDTEGRAIPREEQAFEIALRGQMAPARERRVVRGDGSYYNIIVSANPLYGAEGQILGAVATVTDISRQRQMEEELRESRDRLAWVLATTGIGLWLNELPLSRLNWDTRTRELFFIPPEVTPTIELFWQRLHPDDREPTRLAIEAAFREHCLYSIDHRTVDPATGQIRWIRSAGQATYAADGTPIRFDGINYDITDRKRAEVAVRQSEERFRLAIEATNDAIWDVNLKTGAMHWNETYAATFGRPPEMNDSWQWWTEHIHPADRERTVGTFRAALEGPGTTWNCDYRFLRADGTWADICDRGYIARDASGKAWRVVGAMLDLTERKRVAEDIARLNQDLQRRLAELQTIFETVPIGLAIAEDVPGHHIRGNPAYERMFGQGTGDEPASDALPASGYRCLQQGREVAVTQLPMQQAVRGVPVTGQILDVVRDPGQAITLYSSASPLFDERGKPRGAVGAFLDITSLRRADERARLLSEVTALLLTSDQPQKSVEAICQKVMDHLGCQVFFNFLADEAKRGLQLNAFGGIADEDARRMAWLDEETGECDCLVHDGSRIVAEHIQTTPDPRTRLVRSLGIQAYACHSLVSQGQKIGTLSFGSRVKPTFAPDELALMQAVADHVAIAMQRIRLLESLERHARAADAASEMKSQFLANISHELRTPMNAILGMIDLALPKALDPTVKDCLQTAKGSADLLLTLLNDLLDSAKIEAGKLELELAPFSLRKMLDQITRVLSVRASEKRLSFYCRVPDTTPDAVIGDRMRLQQVLLNLAGNAIKFTEQGEVEISLHALSSATDTTLEFAVRDTGIGTAPSNLALIFQPFAQGDTSVARRFGGTGLGLSICRSLVEMMGGRIWAESEVGKGSTFYFTVRLPLAKELPADFESPTVISAPADAPLRILLVEDNPANQKLATYILQERGHRVEIAQGGHAAVRLAAESHYDAILMDIQMPGMDGLQATAAIRQREAGQSRVPIIAMTAYAMKNDRDRCLQAGMDGYLSKPVDAQELIGLVESVARGPVPPAPLPAATPNLPERAPTATPMVFNPQEALTRCHNQPDIVQEMIQYFFDDVEHLFPQMRAALERGALVEVGQLGHRIKGTLVYLGAQPALEAALAVERLGERSDATPSEAEEVVNSLEHACIRLQAAVSDYPLGTPSKQRSC
ncbi:MAG: PAS domain S-box protein [Pirellulaceae bacterium]